MADKKKVEDEDHHHLVKVHSEMSADLDHDHSKALDLPLRECTDEQLIAELARRKVDIQHRVTSDLVAKYYHFESLLGHGASGKVYLVYHRVSGEKFACKVIKKDNSMNDAESMNTEIEIMKRVRHANIVTLYELFESAQCMWLILELVDGTGLRGGLANHAHYDESVAARFVKQMLTALHYLHSRGVVHRDLKIDNILLTGDRESGNGIIKVTDFGLSVLVKLGKNGYDADDSGKRKGYTSLTQMWGTPTHYAPELIDRAYGPQADMWSFGCALYEMLTGFEAFPSHEGMDRKALYANIKRSDYNKKLLVDLGISHGAQDLIDRILEPSPLKRLSATEALKHPWVLGEGQGRQRLHSAIDAFAAAIEAAKHASDQEATEAALNNNGDEHSTPRRRSTIVANDFINYAAHK